MNFTGMVRDILSDGKPRTVGEIYVAIHEKIPASMAARKAEERGIKSSNIAEKVAAGRRVIVRHSVGYLVSRKEAVAHGKRFDRIVQLLSGDKENGFIGSSVAGEDSASQYTDGGRGEEAARQS